MLYIYTFEVPRLEFVEINFSNDIKVNGFIGDFLPQVIVKKLLISRVKSEPWRHCYLCTSLHHSLTILLFGLGDYSPDERESKKMA